MHLKILLTYKNSLLPLSTPLLIIYKIGYNKDMKAKELMTSKDKVTCLYNDMDLQECYKKLSESHFTMIPVLERESGRYLYSLSTLDILKSIMESNSLEKALKSPLTSIETERLIICAPIESEDAD